MEKILIVDDEKDLVTLIKDQLEIKGYEVITSYDGEDGIEKLKFNPNLILLDIMMPKIDGLEFCKIVRDKVNSPILFLSAKSLEKDKIKALKLGGDDYITKPFSMKELVARIEAHLNRERRSFNIKERSTLFDGLFNLDIKNKEFSYKNIPITLSKKEYEIIELLILNPNQVFSKEQLFDKIWNIESDSQISTVTEHIKNIRNKIQKQSKDFNNLETVWGIGYRWKKS